MKAIFVWVCAGVVVSGCGQKGALYLPDKNASVVTRPAPITTAPAPAAPSGAAPTPANPTGAAPGAPKPDDKKDDGSQGSNQSPH